MDRPVGDPEGMRALAKALRACAADLAGASSNAARLAVGSGFTGPAATRMRTRTAAGARRLVATAGDLNALAAGIDGQAAQVESHLRAYERWKRDQLAKK